MLSCSQIHDHVLHRACLLNNHNVYVFNTSMRLNNTGVDEGLRSNARDRKVTGSSLNREVFSSIIGILESTLDREAMHGIQFLV